MKLSAKLLEVLIAIRWAKYSSYKLNSWATLDCGSVFASIAKAVSRNSSMGMGKPIEALSQIYWFEPCSNNEQTPEVNRFAEKHRSLAKALQELGL